jgi:hypothetical protein|tara:strand:+ start:47 stop:271 length:225 start_codon:yes stop_codon:yes gene_type:complete
MKETIMSDRDFHATYKQLGYINTALRNLEAQKLLDRLGTRRDLHSLPMNKRDAKIIIEDIKDNFTNEEIFTDND